MNGKIILFKPHNKLNIFYITFVQISYLKLKFVSPETKETKTKSTQYYFKFPNLLNDEEAYNYCLIILKILDFKEK
jgi:hypothetical protein